ncbi:hypothetical protein [Actinoplanes sp. HUAS TT8]|uniref:hypothetical protein n=1 Tax=Actinoplanes sp. HUAS TT8 TaxID=3447453 RepID=UPI003F52132C
MVGVAASGAGVVTAFAGVVFVAARALGATFFAGAFLAGFSGEAVSPASWPVFSAAFSAGFSSAGRAGRGGRVVLGTFGGGVTCSAVLESGFDGVLEG